jgi:hypothetical protein
VIVVVGFGVSGFLIGDLHNSNKRFVQITLGRLKLPEDRFYLLGFVAKEFLKLTGMFGSQY